MSAREIGTHGARTRSKILNIAEHIMREKGYSFVTSRQIAAKARLKPPLVHYYFRTMDDLFLALFRQVAERIEQRQKVAIASDRPLKALWDLLLDPDELVLTREFAAAALHRPVIQKEVSALGNRLRVGQTKLLAETFKKNKIANKNLSPLTVAVVMNAIARTLSYEHALGKTLGRKQVLAQIKSFIEDLEG